MFAYFGRGTEDKFDILSCRIPPLIFFDPSKLQSWDPYEMSNIKFVQCMCQTLLSLSNNIYVNSQNMESLRQ